MKKIISMILCLAMLMGLAVSASAASLKGGEYVINDGSQTAIALPENYTYGYLYGDPVGEHDDTSVWTIAKSGDYYSFKDCYGRYIFSVSNYNSYNVSTSAQSDNSHLWSLTASGSGYIVQNVATGKYMGYSSDYSSWGCYADSSQASVIYFSSTDANGSVDNTPAEKDDVAEYVSSVSTKATYKLGLYQDNNGKQLYFDGNTDGVSYRLSTAGEAVNVNLESVSGGYRLYFMDGSTKTYIDIYYGEGDDGAMHVSLRLTTDPEGVYTWDEEYDTLIATVNVDGEETDYYLGTYNTYENISSSKYSYISTSFPCHLYLVDAGEDDTTDDKTDSSDKDTSSSDKDTSSSDKDTSSSDKDTSSSNKDTSSSDKDTSSSNKDTSTGNKDTSTGNKDTSTGNKDNDKTESSDKDEDKTESTDKDEEKEETVTTVIAKVDSPATGVAYKLGCNQENLGSALYFTGTSANQSYYMSTSDNYADGVEVYLESVDGGYLLYFMDGNTKTYLDVYQNGDYVNLQLTTDPVSVYTWNSDYQTLIAVVGDTEYYIGTYNTFSTLSASNIKYISSSFPCHLYEQTTSTNAQTGDSISVFVAMMAVAAIGAGVLVSKKKEF